MYCFLLFASNHCWVSFSGFAEAYNDVFEDEVKKYGSNISTCISDTENKFGGKYKH